MSSFKLDNASGLGVSLPDMISRSSNLFSRPHNMPPTCRLILGLTNGITPALRTTLREVCGEEHVLRGMIYLSGEGIKA